MDQFLESQNYQMLAVDSHDPEWVEKMWMCEDITNFFKHAIQESKDNDGVVSFEMHQIDDPSDLANSTLRVLPGKEGIDVRPKASIHLNSLISRGLYKCNRCNVSAFKYLKDLNRHVNDVHETTKRYRCPVDGCKYGGAVDGHSFKRKDNLRRHLRKHNADFSGVDLEYFLV